MTRAPNARLKLTARVDGRGVHDHVTMHAVLREKSLRSRLAQP